MRTTQIGIWNREKSLTILFSIATVSLFTACGGPVNHTGPFDSYIKTFQEAGQAVYGFPVAVNNVDIHFGKATRGELAECKLFLGQTPEIIVDSDTWGTLSDETKEITILHELGHCVLSRKHDNVQNVSAGRQMNSLMYPLPQDISDYSQYRQDYLQELFQNAGK